ncbi:MAG: choice-of-anchor D domain-containing protein, partial [Calditrichota bacterium]
MGMRVIHYPNHLISHKTRLEFMKYHLNIILVIFWICSFSFAQTYITSGTITKATWTLSGSPYIVQVNLAIDTLIIKPGVVVLFDDNYKFDINDNLHADGFYSDSIYFRPSPGNSNGWQGIKFKVDASASSLSYCRIEGSSLYGIKTEGSSPKIRNCRIVNNKGGGIWVKDNLLNLTHCYIANNDVNGIFPDRGKIIASNLIIAQNNGYGIFSTDTNDSLYLKNVTIADNQNDGIYCETERVFIKNSIIYGNATGINSTFSNLNITYSDVQLDTLVYPGVGNINEDPLLQDSLNYQLSDVSSCIDKGDLQVIYNDKYFPPSKGGDRNDMGAYGSPEANLWYPPIYVKPQSLDFGMVNRDRTKDKNLKILNYRDTKLNISNISFIPNTPDVFLADKSNFNLDTTASTDLMISFTPDSVDNYFADLQFAIDSLGNVFVPLRGQGVIPSISLPQKILDFGSVPLSSDSVLTFRIDNVGNQPVTISEVSIPDSMRTIFIIKDTTFNIDPGDTALLPVKFEPADSGWIDCNLSVISDDPFQEDTTILLTGRGIVPQIQVSSTEINFGKVTVDSSSENLLTIYNTVDSSSKYLLTIYNTGEAILAIDPDSLYFTGFDPGYFLIENELLDTLIKPEDSLEIFILFQPGEIKNYQSELHIPSNDPYHREFSVNLTGSGVVAGLDISSTDLDFGKIPRLSDSLQTLKIFNTGEAQLIVFKDSLTLTSLDYDQYELEEISQNLTLLPGDSQNITLHFHPDLVGPKQSYLNICSNDPGNPKKIISLTGLAYDEVSADIAFSQTHSSNPFMNRKNATAAFTISSHSPVDSAFLFLRRGGKSQFTKYPLVNTYNNVWSSAIDSVQVTERGLDYYLAAYHGW